MSLVRHVMVVEKFSYPMVVPIKLWSIIIVATQSLIFLINKKSSLEFMKSSSKRQGKQDVQFLYKLLIIIVNLDF